MHFNVTFFLFVCLLYYSPAKFMRFPRVKADGQGFYHCISGVVEGRFIFQISGQVRSRRSDSSSSCAA